ncbi:hypothetical protein GCM10010300_72020 [Streptomyces olivaceoviridis]|nr:hypothetical protein GCM10010300_72020 [Streptomyces olivaceoviridis]
MGPVGAGAPASIHSQVVNEIRWIRAEDFAMPAPVRYRSTAAVYDDGGADRGTTRACGNRSAPPLPRSAAGSMVTLPPPFRHCRSKCVHLAPAAGAARRRSR